MGTLHTLAQFRQRFWLPKGKVATKFIIKANCMICRKEHARPYKLRMMPPWPKERVTQTEPFKNIGLGNHGPIVARHNEERKKMWICLFSCMVTRAIHLDGVIDMSTEEFINAFRRFIARRGWPDIILSDNARQFGLAIQALKEAWSVPTVNDTEVIAYFAREQIKWKFIPELAPWHGGMYERMVAMVKKANDHNTPIQCVERN